MEDFIFKDYKITIMSNLTQQRRKSYFNLLVGLSVLVVVVSFSPIILSKDKIEPTLFKMPYTLWTSILATLLLLLFTYIGGRLRGDNGDFSSNID